MNTTASVKPNQHIYRVDKFIVPVAARAEFLGSIQTTQALLKKQQGFVQGRVLEQVSGNGEFNLVTFVEWENQAAIDLAKAAVDAMFKASNYNPAATIQRLGIKADLAFYRQIE
ncbi:MAG: antibiotic biosynthesis monooxygenase [Sideroxydans sp.]|nr:antibiotic biosynthesis monooxygenase [Sideroxydans sp.]